MSGRRRLAAVEFPYSLGLPLAGAFVIAGLALIAWRAPWYLLAPAAAAGLLSWTLVEYLLHRLVLHHVEPFRSWHVEHHRFPDVPMRIPLVYDVLLVAALVAVPALLIADRAFAGGVAFGLLVGHMAQEATHHGLHCGSGGVRGGWFERRRREHDFHHYVNERVAFGTVTSFWDRVFRTPAQAGR